MGVAEIDAGVSRAFGRMLGSPGVVLMRPHTLRTEDQEEVEALEFRTAAAAGATTLDLDLDGSHLEGTAWSSLELTIGGQVYKTTADATADADRLEVEIPAPGLASPAPVGTAVAVAEHSRWDLPEASTYSAEVESVPEELTGRVEYVAMIPRQGAPVEPLIGDLVEDGVRGRGTIMRFEGVDQGSWRPFVGRT